MAIMTHNFASEATNRQSGFFSAKRSAKEIRRCARARVRTLGHSGRLSSSKQIGTRAACRGEASQKLVVGSNGEWHSIEMRNGAIASTCTCAWCQ